MDNENMALPTKEPTTHLVVDEVQELKSRVHLRLLEVLDLTLMDTVDRTSLKREVKRVTEIILAEDGFSVPLNAEEKGQLCTEIQDEILGLGPIEMFMQDPTISDILVNTYKQVFVEKRGKLQLTGARFKDDDHLKNIIDRIVSSVGRRIDESSPMVDARLPDGSRVNVIIPPLAVDGPMMSIRRFAAGALELDDLIGLKTLTRGVGELLKGIVQAELNVLVSGGTGSGKTTMLNMLSRFISEEDRIVTIEDSAELKLKQEHVIRLESRPPNIEGKGEITQRDLVKNCLRMRPDRIILGEVRGNEVLDMLQAMNTGHDGSLTTIHSNSPRDALLRIETLMAIAAKNIPNDAVKRYISSAIHVIIQVSRMVDGSRKVMSIQEITGMEGEVITLQEVFAFEQSGIDENGKVKGVFKMSRILPKFLAKFEELGVTIPEAVFSSDQATGI
jgi:pilus assembly protein CpaF